MKKRVLSLMLATVMCMALAVTANAVEYDSSVLSVEQTSLINGNFPKNIRRILPCMLMVVAGIGQLLGLRP